MFEHGPSTHNTATELFLPFKLIERFDLNFRVISPRKAANCQPCGGSGALCHANRHVDGYL